MDMVFSKNILNTTQSKTDFYKAQAAERFPSVCTVWAITELQTLLIEGDLCWLTEAPGALTRKDLRKLLEREFLLKTSEVVLQVKSKFHFEIQRIWLENN